METMSNPETIFQAKVPIRPMTRIEYERLATEGFFDNERVELLMGVVVPMSPTNPPHHNSVEMVGKFFQLRMAGRARVRIQSSFIASDISEPEPDLMVFPDGDYWRENPSKALLIVEVAESSLRKDKGPKTTIYGLAEVDEYWIVNLVEEVVEVYRDRHEGEWRRRTTHVRGERVAMLAFPDVEIEVSSILPPV